MKYVCHYHILNVYKEMAVKKTAVVIDEELLKAAIEAAVRSLVGTGTIEKCKMISSW